MEGEFPPPLPTTPYGKQAMHGYAMDYCNIKIYHFILHVEQLCAYNNKSREVTILIASVVPDKEV